MALAPLDLVKNLLFSRAEMHRDGSLAEMETRWNEMMTVLERSKIDSFLKAYWASRYGLTEGPKLFSAFKEKFGKPSSAHAASLEMREVADNYVALSDSRDPIWAKYQPPVRKRIEAIALIGATQLNPLILAAMEKFSEHDMSRLLHLIETIAVRYQLVARGRPGRMESLGSQVARKIFEGLITTAGEVRRELSELYPSDERFRTDFLTKTEKDKVTARYMLRVLEKQSQANAGPDQLRDTAPAEDTTLEHIMARTLTGKWPEYLGPDAERHAEYRNRIGNLCLLGKDNKKLGNSLFPDKVGDYAKSGNRLTNMLSHYTNWGCDQIDERQRRLADLAVQAWRFQ